MVIIREDGIPVDGGFLYTQQARMKSSGPPCGFKSQWMILAKGSGRKEVAAGSSPESMRADAF